MPYKGATPLVDGGSITRRGAVRQFLYFRRTHQWERGGNILESALFSGVTISPEKPSMN